MGTTTQEERAKKNSAIQKNAIRMALVVFFVATISAAGGFLQGERVAKIESQNNVASTRFLDTLPAKEKVKASTTATTTATTTKETTPCPEGSTEKGCLDKCSTTYVAFKSAAGAKSSNSKFQVKACVFESANDPIAKLIKEVEQACRATGQSEKIWEAAGCKSDPASVADKAGDPTKESFLSNIPAYFQNLVGKIPANAGHPGLQDARAFCVNKIGELLKGTKDSFANAKAGSATGADNAQCTPKKSVICTQDGDISSQKYTCKPKKDGNTVPGPGNQTPTQKFNDCIKAANGDAAKNQACAQALVNGNNPSNPSNPSNPNSPFAQQPPGGTPSAPSSPGGGKPPGGGTPTPTNNQCPTGYTSTTESGQTGGQVICKKNDENIPKPACLFIASKESIKKGETVTVRWRTANAESVSISNISDSSLNGQQSITPTQTTTYELTATGKGTDNKKTCNLTITVDGEADPGEPTGSAPTKIACSPTTIEKGNSAEVKWQCTSAAIKSAGEGLATRGVLADTATVRPTHNTEYTVSCLDKDDKELGKDSCAVQVGEPKYDIIVHPTTAKRGDRVRVSWASLFMKSCTVKGPRGFDYTRTQGVVITEPFALDSTTAPNNNIRAAIYGIECESQFGGMFSKDVTVKFK